MIGQHGGAPTCPNCHAVADGFATAAVGSDSTADRRPRSGDYSICLYCRTLSIYSVNPVTGLVEFRRPSRVELAEALSEPEIRAALMLA